MGCGDALGHGLRAYHGLWRFHGPRPSHRLWRSHRLRRAAAILWAAFSPRAAAMSWVSTRLLASAMPWAVAIPWSAAMPLHVAIPWATMPSGAASGTAQWAAATLRAVGGGEPRSRGRDIAPAAPSRGTGEAGGEAGAEAQGGARRGEEGRAGGEAQAALHAPGSRAIVEPPEPRAEYMFDIHTCTRTCTCAHAGIHAFMNAHMHSPSLACGHPHLRGRSPLHLEGARLQEGRACQTCHFGAAAAAKAATAGPSPAAEASQDGALGSGPSGRCASPLLERGYRVMRTMRRSASLPPQGR